MRKRQSHYANHSFTSRLSSCLVPLGALLLTGCDAQLGAAGATDVSPESGAPELGAGPGDEISQDEAEQIAESLPWPVSFDGQSVMVRRLSRDELVASFTSLIDQSPARSTLPEEPRAGHGLLLTGGLSFIDSEVRSLWPVVKDFAVQNAPRVLAESGCASAGAEQEMCMLSWAKTLSERVLRHPPSEEEITGLTRLLAGVGVSTEQDVLLVEGVLTALFFSPSFLFRFETEEGSVPGQLSDREIAERLSFLATQGPADAQLLAAAESGALQTSAGRQAEYNRLSLTPAGVRARTVFLLEWLNANESKVSQKSPAYLENLSGSFPEDIRSSAEAAIAAVLSNDSPDLRNLFTTTAYLGDPSVQEVTGPATVAGKPTGDGFDAERRGILMHPYVLSAHTKENGSSPFQLGLALREAVLCSHVSPPPAGALDAARTDPPLGLSQRETLEYVTSASPVCSNCHSQFAPVGYAFLPLDPVGRWQTADPSGKAWDLYGEIATDTDAPLVFSSPSELGDELSDHPQVLGCFVQAAVQWSFGRRLLPGDAALLEELNAISQQTGGDVFQVFDALIASPRFVQMTPSL